MTEMQPRAVPTCGGIVVQVNVDRAGHDQRHHCDEPAGHDGTCCCSCGFTWTGVPR